MSSRADVGGKQAEKQSLEGGLRKMEKRYKELMSRSRLMEEELAAKTDELTKRERANQRLAHQSDEYKHQVRRDTETPLQRQSL
jgi:prefoldin subunit 5